MPTEFAYKARDYQGAAITGIARLDSPEAVRDFLAERNLIPIDIRPRTDTLPQQLRALIQKKSSHEDLILFTRKLNALYRAGIPLSGALGIIADQEGTPHFAGVAAKLRSDIEQGYSFSEAVGQHPTVFSETYLNAVRVAEETGRLDVVMERLASTLERDLETREQIKTAIRYPILVVVLVILAFFGLVTFVVPRFAQFYAKNNAALPLPTQIMLDLNRLVAGYWPVLLVVVVVLIPLGFKLFKLKQVRTKLDGLVLRLPIFGKLLNKIYVSRFAHLLGVAYSSGAPLLSAIDSVKSAVGNRVVEAEIDRMRNQVQQGQSIASIRHQLPHFPSLAISLMQVGLESGSLDFMLQQVASFFDREVDYTTRRLLTLIEPLLILFLGAVVLVMALAIFLPMWNLVEVFRPH